jgi:hypothetical protein
MEFFGNKSGVSFSAIKPVLLRFTKLAGPGANSNSIIHEGSGSCKVSCVAYIGVKVDASTGEANIKCKEEQRSSYGLHIGSDVE